MYSPLEVEKFLARKTDSWDFIKEVDKKDLIEQIHELGGNSFKTVPFVHQLASFLLGIHKGSFLYYLFCGAGKSKIVLDILNYLFNNKKINKTLILVPYTITIESWAEQIKEHSNFMYLPLLGTTKQRWELLKNVNDYDLVGLSYPGLTAMIPHSVIKIKNRKEIILDYTELDKLAGYFDSIILDECHTIKGYNSIIFSICKYLSSKCKYKYGLTGTPTSRNLEDLWAQFYLIDGGETLGKTISFYRQAFFEQKKNYWGGYDYKISKDKKSLLMKIIKNISISYKDTEVFDLPEKINIKRYLLPTKQQTEFYKKAIEGIIEAKGDITLLDNSFVKLRQITSGFIKFISNEGEEVKIIFDENPKLNALLEILNEIGDEKLVVFNDYTITGDIICDKLKQEKIGYERLYGDTEDKYETMQRFLKEKDCRVYVVNSKSGAMSLNLQKAHYQVYFESPVSPIVREQSECRLFRIGQEHKVFIYDFIIKNSIDEKVLDFITEGKDIYKELFKNPKILIK